MEALVLLAGAVQLTRWLCALVDLIDRPPKKKAPPTSDNVREASNPQK